MTNSADPDQLASSEKPTNLDLHCLQKQDISRFSRTRVNSSKQQTVIFSRIFSKKIRLEICHASAWQTIHMKYMYQALISLKNENTNILKLCLLQNFEWNLKG